MTPQEELQRIERLRRELSENRDAVARVARLEERTMFIPAEERPHGYYVDKATLGYRIMVESFRATDQQLTPTQDARLGRVVSVIDGLNSDAERYPWRNDPASRTQASLNSYVQEKMSQLNSVGETFIGSGHETHFNVVRIKRYPDGTLTYTLYDSGHETRGVGVRVDENGERRTQVNAVEERIIRPGASIEALIQAEARKSIVNAMPENGDTRAYQEQRAIIASLTEPTPVRVEVQDAQRRGNCTTRGQRIMMQDILADDGLSARVHGFITENTPHEVFESLGQERENVRAGRVRIPMPELQASESWKPYNSSAFGPSLRFETGYDARVNDVTPQMRSFSDYMSTRGVDVKWGYRDGKAYAYVPQTDQASFNYLEQHIRAAQRAARVDAERTILTPEPTRLVLNNQTFEQVLVERISTPGAIEYLSTNKGPSPIFRGDERTLNFLEQEFSRHGIEFVRETGNTPEFGHGIRVRSQSVEHINQLIRLAPERAAQQRFESTLSDKLANGAIERIGTNKSETIVIRGDAQELRYLNEEFTRRGIDVVMETGENGFGRGLRVRTSSMAQAEGILARIDRGSVNAPLDEMGRSSAVQPGESTTDSHLSAAQQRLHAAIAADPTGRVFDELARRQASADGVTAEEAATREPRPIRAAIENTRLPEIAARAAGTGVRNPYGIEQDRTPQILAEPGNARPGGASTASLFPASFEGAAPDLRVGQGTVEQLRPTSQLRPEVAEVVPADRNASVDRVVNRDAGSVLPVAANDTGVTPRSVNTTARTAPATAANDAAIVAADSAAVSAAAMAAAAAGSDGVRPVPEPHRANAGNRAAGGAGLAMSTQMIQAIQEKLARGEEVSTAEYIAAGVNVGYSALDTAGVTAIDDAVAGQLGRLTPRLAKVGGPLVQAALAVPMIYSASETGDPKAIGAASFGAIGGIGAGMAGQALIPIPGVGFVVGVVVGEGAAHVGGLAADAMYNEDPAKREAAVKELQQIQRDYIPNPLDPLRAPGATMNLAGAAVSSVGRAVNTIGEVASWGGEQIGGLANATEQSLSQGLGQYMPQGAANLIGKVAVTPIRVNAATLQAAGAVVSAVGTGVDMVGQGVEAVGHTANRAADETKRVAGRATEEFGRTFTREYQRDPTVRGAARATVAATVDVAERAGNYAVRRANEAYESGREVISAAGSWLADRTPAWLGGNAGRDRDDDETPARRAPAARRPAAPAAASRVTISQQALDGLERAGWTRRLDLNGDGQLSVAEVNAAFRRHGITARQVDDDRSGTLNAQEISEDLNNAIRSRRGHSSGRG